MLAVAFEADQLRHIRGGGDRLGPEGLGRHVPLRHRDLPAAGIGGQDQADGLPGDAAAAMFPRHDYRAGRAAWPTRRHAAGGWDPNYMLQIGRTSMLPNLALGILAAMAVASSRSLASTR